MRSSVAFFLIGTTVMVGACSSSEAAIYAFTDERGTVHYTNVPTDSRFRLLIATPSDEVPTLTLQELLEKSAPYLGMIEHAAQANHLDPALVRAVIVAESACNPQATSRRGARGLMQLMPDTARQYGVHNAFDPEQNIRAGSRYLRDLTDRYENDLQLILAAYNAGPQAVDSHGKTVPPFRETLDYVPRVLRIYHRLIGLSRPS